MNFIFKQVALLFISASAWSCKLHLL